MRLFHFPGKAPTVDQAIERFNISRSDIVKSILLFAGKTPLLCILQGDRSIDFSRIRSLTNENNIRMATPAEVLKHTGYEVGAVTPLSSLDTVFLDPPVQEKKEVYAGGGTKDSLMLVSVSNIIKASDPLIVPISKPKSL